LIYPPPKPYQLVIGLLILAALIPFIPPEYSARMSTLLNIRESVASEASLRGRSGGMLVSLKMFVVRPILGVGYANYLSHYQKYARQVDPELGTDPVEPHNLVLEIAAETGLAGLFAMGLILWAIFKGLAQAWRKYRDTGLEQDAALVASFTIALIGYLSASFFIHGAYPRYFWLICGIGFGISAMTDKELSSQRSQTE